MNEQLKFFEEPKNEEILEFKISNETTGDPFVDVGNLVLSKISELFPGKKLMEKINWVCKIYVERWGGKLHSLYLNSEITQPAYKGKEIEETCKYFVQIFRDKEEFVEGFCKTCGYEGKLFVAGRNNFCLTGSEAFVNFHNSHEVGSYLCKNCIVKLFFVPLGVIQLGKMLGLLQLQSEITKKFWAKFIIQKNFDKISRNVSEKILEGVFKNPQNSLFYFVKEILSEFQDANSESLTLIHFTNFGAKPNLQIYILTNPVFEFVAFALKNHAFHWNSFVRSNYKIKNAKWNFNKDSWEKTAKNSVETLEEEDYLNNPNTIFENLLANKSILPQLLKKQRLNYIKQLDKFPISITFNYVRKILEMRQETINLIKKITDVIFEISKEEDNYKKFVQQIEGANKAFILRNCLLRLNKKNFQNGKEEPMLRLKDYVEYLFPDGQNWSEIRDLLLICIYEKLHDEKVNSSEIGLSEEIAEPEDDEQTI